MTTDEHTIKIRYDKIENKRYVRTITYQENNIIYIVDTPLNFSILNNIKEDDLKKDFDTCVIVLKNKPLKMFKSRE